MAREGDPSSPRRCSAWLKRSLEAQCTGRGHVRKEKRIGRAVRVEQGRTTQASPAYVQGGVLRRIHLFPLAPLILCFDGLVSCLRAYSLAEL